ncbi:MAG: phosphotransferase, partial [Halieaceae bacterium]
MVARPVPPDLLPWAMGSLASGGGDPALVLEDSDAGDTDAGNEGAAPKLTVIAGDASNRRYFRLSTGGQTYVIAEAPPETEKNPEFLSVRQLLAEAGVRVPSLIAADLDQGYLLLEDLGDRVLLPELNDESVDDYYQQCFSILHCLARAGESAAGLPA